MRKYAYITAIACGLSLTACGAFNKSVKPAPSLVENKTAETEAPLLKNKESVENAKSKLDGEWIILSALGKETNPRTGQRPYMAFNMSDNKIYGNLGCNYINGSYTLREKNGISFGDVTTTLRDCDFLREETNIVESINRAASFNIHKKNGKLFLELFDASKNLLLTSKRHYANMLSGSWTVKKIKGKEIEDMTIELVIDIPELKLHGNTGCNIINGAIGLDRNKDWFVQFLDISSTRRACDKKTTAIERDLLVALEEVEIINRQNDKTTELLDKDKNVVLTLKRTQLTND